MTPMPKITVTTPKDTQRTFSTEWELLSFLDDSNSRANLFVDADGDVVLALWDSERLGGRWATFWPRAEPIVTLKGAISYPVRLAPVGTELKITQTEEC